MISTLLCFGLLILQVNAFNGTAENENCYYLETDESRFEVQSYPSGGLSPCCEWVPPGVECERTSVFNANQFTSALNGHCRPLFESLRVCEAEYKLRDFEAASWSFCFTWFLTNYFSDNILYYFIGTQGQFDLNQQGRYPGSKGTFIFLKPNGSCIHPDFTPIWQEACQAQLEGVNGTDNGYRTGELYNLLDCQTEAAIHYARCSEEYNSTLDVTSCVTNVTKNLGWVQSGFLIDNGKPHCPNAKALISKLGLWNALAFLATFVGNRRALWALIRRHSCPRDEIELSFVAILWHIGAQVGMTVLAAYAVRRPDTSPMLFEQIQVWAVRPRAAVLIALLGFIHPVWVGMALKAMITDFLLCMVAIGMIKTVATSPPTGYGDKPAGYTAYRFGAVVSIIPTIIAMVVFALLLLSTLKCSKKSPIYRLLREAGMQIANMFRKIGGKETTEPTTYEWNGHRYLVIYVPLFVLSLLLYIGNWMFWSGFLTVSGRLYCPAEVRRVTLLWSFGPWVVQLVGLLLDTLAL